MARPRAQQCSILRDYGRLRLLPPALAFLAAAGSGCSSSAYRGGGRTGAALANAAAPAAALVPDRTAYLVWTRRISRAADGIRGFLEPLRALSSDITPDRADQELRRSMGGSPLDTGDLDDAGIDLAGDAAFFESDGSPTIALRIADDQRLDRYLAERTRPITTYLRIYRGLPVTSWNLTSKRRGFFTKIDGYLLVHLELGVERPAVAGKGAACGRWGCAPGKTAPRAGGLRDGPLPWIDFILSARDGRSAFAASASPSWSLSSMSAGEDLFAFVDPLLLHRDLSPPSTSRGCNELERLLSGARRISAAAKLDRRSLALRVLVELSPAARSALEEAMTGGPELPRGELAAAPARFELLVRGSFFADLVARLGGHSCGLADSIARELGFSSLRDTIFDRLDGGVSAALLASDERGKGALRLRAAVLADCRNEAGRSWLRERLHLEKTEPSRGREVYLARLETAVAEPVRVSLADDLLRIAVGESLMEPLVGAPRARSARPLELFELHLEPPRLADLRAPLRLLEDSRDSALPYTFYRSSLRRDAERLATLASAYSRIQLGARLDPSGIRIDAEYRIR